MSVSKSMLDADIQVSIIQLNLFHQTIFYECAA